MNVPMQLAEISAPSSPKSGACSVAPGAAASPVKPVKPDRITFGMDVSTSAGCCVDKLKTGRTDSCCSHLSHEKFVAGFKAAVQREFEQTGVKPELDPLVQAILDGKAQPVPNAKAAEPSAPQAGTPVAETRLASNKFVRILTWPFRETARLFKWLTTGFWDDLKYVGNALKQRLPRKSKPESP